MLRSNLGGGPLCLPAPDALRLQNDSAYTSPFQLVCRQDSRHAASDHSDICSYITVQRILFSQTVCPAPD